jgi:hypothetical protein
MVMPAIMWTTAVTVDGDAAAEFSRSFQVPAVDRMSVTVADGASDLEVEIKPASAATVHFFLLQASVYAAGLTYKLADAGNPGHAVDQPQLLAGSGVVDRVGGDLSRLFVSNATGGEVTLRLVVGRDVTP